MEEKIIDKEDERLIRIKKKGREIDAEDATLSEGEESSEEEIFLTLPEEGDENEEYDEDMVGLTPSEFAREKARRQKAEEAARIECGKILAEGEAALKEGAFERATTLFEQAACYGFDEERVATGLWTARTKNFATSDPFHKEENAEEFAALNEEIKNALLEKMKERLKKERTEFENEEKALAPDVLAKQETRRQAFVANRKYYAVRFLILAGILALFALASAASGFYIVRTLSATPVVLTGVFGGIAVISFVATLVLFLKFLGANKLCRANDRLSSTQDGARLAELRNKIECLNLVLGDKEGNEE